MFEDPMQWLVIGVVILALLLWGPNKIPQLASSIGKARREFDLARKSVENPMGLLLQTATQPQSTQGPSTEAAPQPSTPAPPVQAQPSGDDVLVRTAKDLGIVTEGKTSEQLSAEIVSRATAKAPDSEAKAGQAPPTVPKQ